jgi:hypothetical protein
MHARACPAATNRSRPGSRLPGPDIKARTDRIDIINLAESKGKTTAGKVDDGAADAHATPAPLEPLTQLRPPPCDGEGKDFAEHVMAPRRSPRLTPFPPHPAVSLWAPPIASESRHSTWDRARCMPDRGCSTQMVPSGPTYAVMVCKPSAMMVR